MNTPENPTEDAPPPEPDAEPDADLPDPPARVGDNWPRDPEPVPEPAAEPSHGDTTPADD